MPYEGLNLTLLGSTPISNLYSKPIGQTLILMTDEHSHARPVLFDGPACGGHHFLEARQRKGKLEIISTIIQTKDLGQTTAESVKLVSIMSKDRKEADRVVGLFDYTGGRSEYVYCPEETGYPLLLEKLKAIGLAKWAQANPYQERIEVHPHSENGGDQEAE